MQRTLEQNIRQFAGGRGRLSGGRGTSRLLIAWAGLPSLQVTSLHFTSSLQSTSLHTIPLA